MNSYPQAYTQAKAFITKRYNRYIVIADNRYKIVINKQGKYTLKALDTRVYAGHAATLRSV